MKNLHDWYNVIFSTPSFSRLLKGQSPNRLLAFHADVTLLSSDQSTQSLLCFTPDTCFSLADALSSLPDAGSCLQIPQSLQHIQLTNHLGIGYPQTKVFLQSAQLQKNYSLLWKRVLNCYIKYQ